MSDARLLREQLRGRVSVVLDGAMGTELSRRGVTLQAPRWSAAALEGAPSVVRDVHRDYVQGGAQVITTNTFSLDSADTAAIECAVALAREGIAASDRSDRERVRIAGSIGALGRRMRPPPVEHRHDIDGPGTMYGMLARELVRQGCDLLFVETVIDASDAAVAVAAIDGAQLNVPLWLSVACGADGSLLGVGELDALPSDRVDALLVACTEGTAVAEAMAALPPAFTGWRGIAPSTGKIKDGRFDAEGTEPASLEREVAAIRATERIDIVGGCCGTTPAFIATLASRVHANAAARSAAFDRLDQHLSAQPARGSA
ncbi:MAG: homocysteine S-methyltransferase family protein [Myxococcota bacterium]